MKKGWVSLFVLIIGVCLSARAHAAHYYMTVFGYQDACDTTVYSHTFATFVSDEDLARGLAPESYPTISWLPESQDINRVLWQQGHNFNLPQTLALARSLGVAIQYWGPFEITPSLYNRALYQIAYLQPQNVSYKMIDGWHRPDALNCIHAVSDIGGDLQTGTLHGFGASAAVVQFLSPYIVGYPYVHPEVAQWMRLPALLSGQL